MNKLGCLIIMLIACTFRFASGQILCIYCYGQNNPIGLGINNLIQNGSFENGCGIGGYFCPASGGYSCDITNWTCIGGGSSTYAHVVGNNFAPVVDGIKTAYFGSLSCNACDSLSQDTTCLINLSCTTTGIPVGFPISGPTYGGALGISLEQVVLGLIIDSTYALEFWAGGEAAGGDGLFAVDIGFGKTFIRDKPTWAPTTTSSDTIGRRYIIEFIATSTIHTIEFTNWGHIPNCTELVLDDVRLYTLAELSLLVPHCIVGMDNSASQNSVNIFPDPVSNSLTVETNSNELLEIILYDITYRKLLRQSFSNTISINTEQLPKGIYLYEVRNNPDPEASGRGGVIKKGKMVKD